MKSEPIKPNFNQNCSLVVKHEEIENLKHKVYNDFSWMQ